MVLLADNRCLVIVQGLNIMNGIVDIQIYENLWTPEIKICHDYHTHPLVQTFNYFMSLDMPVMELLGSSETGGPQTACLKVAFLIFLCQRYMNIMIR